MASYFRWFPLRVITQEETHNELVSNLTTPPLYSQRTSYRMPCCPSANRWVLLPGYWHRIPAIMACWCTLCPSGHCNTVERPVVAEQLTLLLCQKTRDFSILQKPALHCVHCPIQSRKQLSSSAYIYMIICNNMKTCAAAIPRINYGDGLLKVSIYLLIDES